MTDSIHLTVATVVHRNGQFLVVKETSEGRQVYNQPAGHVEPGESLQEAAIRETLEETGWQVELTGLIGFYVYTSRDTGITYYRAGFAANPVKFLPESSIDQEIDQVLWLTYDQILDLRDQWRSPLVPATVNDFLEGPLQSLDVLRDHR